MKREDLSSYLNKLIRITCYFGFKDKFGNKLFTIYTGYIRNITDSSVTIVDKFGNLVTVKLSDIVRVEEVKVIE